MEIYIKKKSISALAEGDVIDDIFAVKIKKGFQPYVKGFCFEILITDNSGKTLEYKYWGGNDENKVRTLYESIKSDNVIRVQGKVSVYNNKLQLATNEPMLVEVLQDGQYIQQDFIKPAKKDITQMYEELQQVIAQIVDSEIKKLLEVIFREKGEKFKQHPGAIEIHHNWMGGLLQHTLEVVHFCQTACQLYPALNKDLLLAGALLHDIGKLEELEMTSRIKGTVKGQLVGHLVFSTIYLSQKLAESSLPEEMKNKLLHLIVSHHGHQEYGSPKEPMFPEAIVLYYADELSSKAAEMLEYVEDGKTTTEDDFIFSKRHGRNIYLK